MNIFALSTAPQEAAIMQCDKHVVKMTLETGQILSTVHHIHGSDHARYVYKPTHTRHPCVLWAAENTANYRWLSLHFASLAEEYQHRFDKTHKTFVDLMIPLQHIPPAMPVAESTTPFAKAVSDPYKWFDDPVDAYRHYYLFEKADILNYTRRERPSWMRAIASGAN